MHRYLLLSWMLAATPAAALEHVVVIGPGFVYRPEQLQIESGDSVRFSASDAHPLRSDTDLFYCLADCVLRFDTPGTFGFHCETHGVPAGAMHGTLTVLAAGRIHADGFESAPPE